MVNFLKHFRKTKSPYQWANTYDELSFKPVQNTDIDEVQFIVLDCETTGLEKTAELVTIGAVSCTTSSINIQKILDLRFYSEEIGTSSQIHGELEMHDQEVSEEDQMAELLNFINSNIIVGHNIGFDLGMIKRRLELHQVQLRNRSLDTAKLAIRLDPVRFERSIGGGQLTLDSLLNEYGIEVTNRHTAVGDAFLTAQLLQCLLNRLKSRGIAKLGDLL